MGICGIKMYKLKTEKDIIQIQKAINIGLVYLYKIKKHVKPGITTLKLNNILEKWLNRPEAEASFKGYNGFPYATCMSVNKDIIHGLPNNKKLEVGDILKIDLGINYKGYYSDQAETIFVGEHFRNKEEFRLVYATKLALDRAIKVAIVGNSTNTIGTVIEATAKEFGVSILKDWTGHGVGFGVHEEPRIYNNYCLNNLINLKKGMVIAIEPMFVIGQGNYKIKEDGFTVEADGFGAHFERTVIIK